MRAADIPLCDLIAANSLLYFNNASAMCTVKAAIALIQLKHPKISKPRALFVFIMLNDPTTTLPTPTKEMRIKASLRTVVSDTLGVPYSEPVIEIHLPKQQFVMLTGHRMFACVDKNTAIFPFSAAVLNPFISVNPHPVVYENRVVDPLNNCSPACEHSVDHTSFLDMLTGFLKQANTLLQLLEKAPTTQHVTNQKMQCDLQIGILYKLQTLVSHVTTSA